MADQDDKGLKQADDETLLDLDDQAQLEENQTAHEAISAELEKRGIDVEANAEEAEGHPS